MSHSQMRNALVASLLAMAAAACGNANAERAAQLAADSARAAGASPAEVTRRSELARNVATGKAHIRTAASGTTLRLSSVTDVTSQKDEAGKPFTARTTMAVVSSGDTVIPVGAELSGRVSVLQSAPRPGTHGQMAIEFHTLRFGGQSYPVAVDVVSLATHEVARGVTVEDAAKVGVGAAAGAIAGRIIGGNRTGAAVGAVAGGAGGAVYANRTKDHDIALTPGSAIEVKLTSPFSRAIVSR